MPPRRYSRYAYTQAYQDDAGALVLTEPEPFRYVTLTDNRMRTVTDGDTLFALAAVYFASFPRPAGLWWIIADFQPDPIIDPTLQLDVGRVIVIPSERTVSEKIFNDRRRLVT